MITMLIDAAITTKVLIIKIKIRIGRDKKLCVCVGEKLREQSILFEKRYEKDLSNKTWKA